MRRGGSATETADEKAWVVVRGREKGVDAEALVGSIGRLSGNGKGGPRAAAAGGNTRASPVAALPKEAVVATNRRPSTITIAHPGDWKAEQRERREDEEKAGLEEGDAKETPRSKVRIIFMVGEYWSYESRIECYVITASRCNSGRTFYCENMRKAAAGVSWAIVFHFWLTFR